MLIARPIGDCRISFQYSACIAAALVAFVLSASGALAQSGRVRSAPADSDSPIRLMVDEVLLPISVQSINGRLPDSLPASDIALFEDHHRHPVTSLTRTPAHILFIVDNSNQVTTLKRSELNCFVAKQILASLAADDSAAILTYADRVTEVSGWSTDKIALNRLLDYQIRPGIKAHLYESLIYASEHVLPSVNGRRSIVLLTDGYDVDTKNTLEAAKSALDRVRATIYIVAQNALILKDLKPKLGGSGHHFGPGAMMEGINRATDPGYRKLIAEMYQYCQRLEAEAPTLEHLAADSGGAFWNPDSAEEFRRLGAEVTREIGSEYVISYSSERRANEWGSHKIEVVPVRAGLRIRARRNVYSVDPSDTAPAKEQAPRQ